MNGRWYTLLLLFVVPIVGIAATVAWFSANPLVIFVAIGAIVLGALYLLTYTETFA
jgi:hypothetical protein